MNIEFLLKICRQMWKLVVINISNVHRASLLRSVFWSLGLLANNGTKSNLTQVCEKGTLTRQRTKVPTNSLAFVTSIDVPFMNISHVSVWRHMCDDVQMTHICQKSNEHQWSNTEAPWELHTPYMSFSQSRCLLHSHSIYTKHTNWQ